MNLEVLMNEYANDARCFQIVAGISLSMPKHIHLSGLHGSAAEFIIAAVFNNPSASQLNHLVVLRDAEEAAYFHNTLENLTSALDIFYFPSSFKNKKNYRLLNSSHVMLRTEALTKIAAAGASVGINKKIIITHPEALFEKVVLQKTLSANIISIKQGETIDVNDILGKFVGHGFERTDFVYEPGQFAVRGGILDIYSFGNEKPYRIELFGNEVDSIRLFDPESQLSERKLLQVNIIPNVETQFETGERVSLLEFLPENTVVWTEDWQFIKERIEQQEEDLELFLSVAKDIKVDKKQLVDEDTEINERLDINENDFVKAAVIEEEIKTRNVIEISKKAYFTKALAIGQTASNAVFHIKEQPSFNRQFDLLIKDLKEYEAKKYNIYIFAENPKQLERLHIIFTDLKAEINVVPVPTSIHHGFIDDDLKVVCYTDHQIFQRYHKYKVKQAFSKNKALTLKMLR